MSDELKITISHVELVDNVGGECDCCGGYQGDGVVVRVNGEEAWRRECDGHMGGFETAGTLMECVLAAVECRLMSWWSDDCVMKRRAAGTGWKPDVSHALADAKSTRDWIAGAMASTRERCVELPHSTENQLRVIAAWLDDEGFGTTLEFGSEPMYPDQVNTDFGEG